MNATWQMRKVLFVLLCLLQGDVGYSKATQERYPNELQGFKFYAKYLAPLRPGISSRESVRRVLGDTAAVKRNGWTIIPTYTTKAGPVYNPTLGPLYQVIVRPDGAIPMGAVKFPSTFAHCHTSESEINISFDVYSDTFGLEYWLHEEDSKWGKKGDLYRIVYGPTRRPFPPNTIC
ncbi:MAG: hypothetical protein LAP86_33700 [Acidobacteriia bacterium]|nr:hypothetical protein [Terriglobia bacterium]